MREISFEEIALAVEKLCVRANTVLSPDIGIMLETCAETEYSDAGRDALCDMVENFKYAASTGVPICQDTGMAVVFADVGQDVHITGGLFSDAVDEGVRRGYVNGLLRLSVVKDPLRRVNTDDNTPSMLHTNLVEGDKIRLTVAPKGFGSENMSAMKLFLPSTSQDEVVDFIVQTVSNAGSNPCPPVIVGVGLGGTIEKAALTAKRALLRPVDKRNPDEFYAALEKKALDKINALGIGPQGFGGRYTALAVNIDILPTHIAGMPCVVNMGCHVTRHASTII